MKFVKDNLLFITFVIGYTSGTVLWVLIDTQSLPVAMCTGVFTPIALCLPRAITDLVTTCA